jgi:hypothetical protein
MTLAQVGIFNPLNPGSVHNITAWASDSADGGSQYGRDWQMSKNTKFLPRSDDINVVR